MAEWERKPFAAVLKEPVRNGIYKSKEFHGRGCKIVNMGELFAHSRMYSIPMKRVDLNESERKRFLLNSGDLIFARRSLTAEGAGKCSIVLEVAEPTTFESSIIRARPNPKLANPEFLFYFFSSLQGYQALDTIRRQVAVAGITGGDLSQLLIPVPPVPIQDSIAKTLSLFDLKIELNRRMNETLEGMAQAIFRDWFVDFGPVRRAQAGATDPVAIMGGLTPDPARAAHLAALFPAAFGSDGLPGGWSERPLDSIAEFLNGLALQKHPAKPGEPDLPVIKIAELRNGLSDRTNRAARTLPARYIIEDGDFIFSWSGSLMAKVWTEGEGALNQHLYKVSSDVYPQWFYGLWVHHHMPEFQLIAASKATTMGHIQRMHLSNAATVCPPDPTIEAMSAVMQPLWDRMIHNELENRTLAETRDYLLPRLMSGAVRVVPKAEAA
jgi:type I restriction enzyme S subunit